MKHLSPSLLQCLGAGILLVAFASRAPAAESVSNPATPGVTGAVATTVSPAGKLPYGVDEVVNLSRAQVSEDIITTYIQTSGTVYYLRPTDIVYLRNQGVSDRIVLAMMDQRRKALETPAQPSPEAPAVPVNNNSPVFVPGQGAIDSAQSYAQPIQVEVPAPASTLYVIPNTPSFGYQPVYTFYPGCSYRPCYAACYSSYGYCAPSTVVRIGVTGRRFHSLGGVHRVR